MNLFGRMLNHYQINPADIRVCDEHPEVTWQQWFEMRSSATRYIWTAFEKAVDWLPAGLFHPGAQAFERIMTLAITLVASIVCYKLGDWFGKLCMWLFPCLDPTNVAKQGLLNDLKRRAQEEHEPPISLLVAIEKLEDELGTPDNKRMTKRVTAEACIEALEKEEKAKAESCAGLMCWCGKDVATCPHVAESHQHITQGVRAKPNLESHQERTQGAKPKTNIESHQDRTAGAKVRNVEAEGEAEATNDQNAVEIVHKVKRNIYGIQILEGDERYFVGNLLFVIGKIAITNKHILKLIRGKTVRLFNMNCQKGIVLTADQTAEMNESKNETELHGLKDVVALEMPRHCLVHADITKFFQTKEDFARYVQPSGVCVLGYGRDAVIQGRYSDKCQAIDRVAFDLIEKDGTTTQVRDWYRYGVHSMPGDCGSAVIVHDPSVPRKLIGIHMAGYGSDGYFGVGVAVHQELLKSLIKNLPLKNAESNLDGEFAFEGKPTERSFGDFVSFGTAAATSNSMATVIRKGPVYGMLAEPKTAPAKLRPFVKDGEIVDPLEMARKKADTPNVPVDEKILKQCSKHYSRLLLDLKKDDRDDKVLTWEQAIQGTGEEFYLPIKRNTSPGYGWNSKGKGKEPWLGSNENYITDHPDVIARRDEMMERIMSGKRASTVFVDTLKDERRPLDRVRNGKTRLFAAGEMVYCLLVRQYFAGFSAHIMRNCIDAESTVGINPFGHDWSKLSMRLSECGPHVVAGDFSNYDGTLCSAILWEVYDVVEAFFQKATDEERMIRRALWCELVNSVHVTVPFNGTVPEVLAYLYQWSHSQPSGNPLTVILNSVYHSIVMRYVFKLCARKYAPHMVGLDNWDKYVRHVNYGDDDVTNIHPEIIGWFNQLTMTEAFLTIGMVYTDEAKSGELVQSRKLEDVSFLKRKFRWDPEQARWRCPHSLDVILEMPMWVKRNANVYELTATVLEEAVHELAQHSKEVFLEKMKVFEEAREKVREYWGCTFLTYEEYAEVDMARLGWKEKMDIRDEREIDALFA
uniref:ORF1 n=1 Tax=Bemisia tabaci dicistro-like virus 1 TaxID=2840019 RepID=A0A8E8FU32_9VIRU|nr:ORF1 [Bemisia tabaci dicistro-like virus 1]